MSQYQGSCASVRGEFCACANLFSLLENGKYFIGWTLLDVLKLYVAAVPETRDFSLDR